MKNQTSLKRAEEIVYEFRDAHMIGYEIITLLYRNYFSQDMLKKWIMQGNPRWYHFKLICKYLETQCPSYAEAIARQKELMVKCAIFANSGYPLKKYLTDVNQPS